MLRSTCNRIVDFSGFVVQAKRATLQCSAQTFNYTGDIMTNHSPVFSIARVMRVTAMLALTLILYAPVSPAAQQPKEFPDAATVESIAAQGFVYGLPIVMHYAVTYEYSVDTKSPQYKAPFNALRNGARVFTYKDTVVITPNSDTPYSFACLDLRAEPVIITVPKDTDGRYFSVQLVDANTFNFGYIGSRTTGNGGGSYLVAGPEWKGTAPAGMRVFRSNAQFAMALFRTQLFSPADIENVLKFQTGYAVKPLSAFLGQTPPPALPMPPFPNIGQDFVKPEFFDYLAFALQFAPAGPEEVSIRAQLASIGVVAGKPFAFDALPKDTQAAVLRGLQKGADMVDASVTRPGLRVNGWKMSSPFGNREFFNGDWLMRAAGAKAGIYGNDAEEAVYPMTKTLADGSPLDGSKHKYRMTIPAGQYPPAKAFWSVTMYDGNTQLLIKNPIDRYLINSPMLPDMKKNPDGSLTILIQRDTPGKEHESNWLPAPDGPIFLVMRLYWPETEGLSVLPLGKGTWQPPKVELND